MLSMGGYAYSTENGSVSELQTFGKVWGEIVNMTGTGMTHFDALEKFKIVLNAKYDHENSFDKALLELWCDLLGDKMQRITFIVEETGQLLLKGIRLVDNKRVGIVSQVHRTKLFDRSIIMTSSRLISEALTDHATVIFDREDIGSVRDCTAVVQLKSEASNCKGLTLDVFFETFSEPDLANQHLPIGELIVYNAGDVLHSLRRNGCNDNRFSLLVLACNQNNQNNETTKKEQSPYRYVRGELKVPSTIGDRFTYNIKEAMQWENEESLEKAATAYVTVICEGLKRAISITTRVNQPEPAPLCGSNFRHPDGYSVSCKLVGTPIVNKKLAFDMGQAEMFECNLSTFDWSVKKRKIVSKSSTEYSELDQRRIEKTKSKLRNVLIKVTCFSVHSCIQTPYQIVHILSDLQKLNPNPLEKVLVDHVHYARSKTCVVILNNLRKLGYQDFQPEELSATLEISSLLDGIGELAAKILVPMAKKGIVHADLRFGWDRCCNIMASVNGNGGTIDLQPIDLESLCCVWDSFPTVNGTFHLDADRTHDQSHSISKRALSYIWWQLFLVAYTWFHKISHKHLQAKNIIQKASRILERDDKGYKIDGTKNVVLGSFRKLFRDIVDANLTGTEEAIAKLCSWMKDDLDWTRQCANSGNSINGKHP